MTIVLDCSVVASALLDQPFTANAHRVLASPEPIHAPALLASELANAFWLQAREGRLSAPEAAARLRALEASGIELVDDMALRERALCVALQAGCTCYDAEYIALAEMLDAVFVTADRRQLRAARGILGDRGIWLGDA